MEGGSVSLQDLPRDCLPRVFRCLSAKDLASLSLQCRELRSLVLEDSRWESVCKERWSRACLGATHSNWAQLYRERDCLPDAFCNSVDKLQHLGQYAESHTDKSAEAFQHSMESVYSIGLHVHQVPSLKLSAEYREVSQILAEWAADRAEDVVKFAHQASEALDVYDAYMGVFVNFPDIPWRRSALAFLLDMLSERGKQDFQNLISTLEDAAEWMDHLFRSIEAEAEGLSLHIPRGLPASHWWFSLTGCSNTPVC